ncbi:DNA mismatch repair protein MutS [Bacteroidetes bacterium SCGC AAA795-G10]|nr:DNA mismatch repair protein MutS [Bacteroidetes bacterium SCGC AAA795-G10]
MESLIPNKTLEDLEYIEVLNQCANFAITQLGKDAIQKLQPSVDTEQIEKQLKSVSEFKSSFDNENRIPNHGFESLLDIFPLLKIENSVLTISSFRNMATNTETTNKLIKFLIKFQAYYPTLYEFSNDITIENDIIPAIERVIDRFGEIRDKASDNLFSIRKKLQQLRGKISSSFNKSLSQYNGADYLDDIKESIVNNRRVLAVKAMYRRKVKGTIMGSSKTGSIVFIEPETTYLQNQELQNLLFEETEEIKKILSGLTDFFRPYLPYFQNQHSFLLKFDIIYAKACYGNEIDGIFPKINSDEKEINYKKAFHPLLLQTNKSQNKSTYPQDIKLNSEHRIIVISGPNAGGKSITLKTVGLLQLMLQSGMLIPVKENSVACIFELILTDIGDNQSIENQLSTYSYRLNNMKYFLKKCNSNTLFLIDEFGTGSDPELGGALAEVILEDFYEREALGLITTHYSNLKVLATELPKMINANMQFDSKTLEPIFKLVLGEAGSSFTFEVAQKNGLPYNLVNRAKKKIEKGKVRFDATIAKLQKERNQLLKTGESLKKKESKAEEQSEQTAQIKAKLKSKLSSYQELFDHNQKMIVLGNKFNEIGERFFKNNKKRPLISELLKLVENENSKRKKKSNILLKTEKEKKKKINEQVNKEIALVRKEKKKNKIDKPKKSNIKLKVGDSVRMFDGRSVGSIDLIEKNKAIVNYGVFKTQVSLDLLEIVEDK